MSPARDPFLIEAKRLHHQGFGVHWLKPTSKAPVKSGWADGTRDNWDVLRREYQIGYGLGVRLGAASKFEDGTFLANLDVDVKGHEVHWDKALAAAQEFLPGIDGAPFVRTGYGIRYFFRTTEPVTSRRLRASPERVKVRMPSAPVSKEQEKACEQGLISIAELKDGLRVRVAWELELMSAGKQVVLPPTVHPDTGKAYVWGGKHFTVWTDFPVFDVTALVTTGLSPGRLEQKTTGRFKPVLVDLVSDNRISPRVVELIYGEGVDDRSAACFSVALELVRVGLSDAEILTLLTDRETLLGETAYDHAQTTDRARAALWVQRYCLAKARAEVDPAMVFRDAPMIEPLTTEAATRQRAELVVKSEVPWESRVVRVGKNGEGPPKPSLENVLLFLRNVVSPDLFRRNLFEVNDYYGTKAPWSPTITVGKAVTDDDIVLIKSWFGRRFGFEPSSATIFDAVTDIALRNAYHPVQDELRALPEWDGVGRLDGWLKRHFQAEGDDAYLAQVFRKWMVASVKRTFEPGAKFDWLPIFEGQQGIGKSSFGAILFGAKYFADWLPNLVDKDAALALVGKRCVEFSELESLRRAELTATKAFITRQVDKLRPPYGRKQIEYARGCVFLGTTNAEEYLVDSTGNRRFAPVRVGQLDFERLARDRDQLWAEAYTIYELGLDDGLYVSGDATRAMQEEQAKRMVKDDSDICAEMIFKWYEKEMSKNIIEEKFNFNRFRSEDMVAPMGPLGGHKWDNRASKMVAKALRKLGFESYLSEGLLYWRKPAFGKLLYEQ